MVVLGLQFSMQFIQSALKVPAKSVGIFFSFESHQFELVVFLLLTLHHCLLLETGLLQVFIFEYALLVTQSIGFSRKLSALLL